MPASSPSLLTLAAATLLSVGLTACATDVTGPTQDLDYDCSDGKCDAVVEALCQTPVAGSGTVNVEPVFSDSGVLVDEGYLAHVVACENPLGDPESLRAQAIAARSFLHHVLSWKKQIGDSEYDQVYGCGRSVEQKHVEAVVATSGIILMHRGEIIAGMYSAGAVQNAPTCEDNRLPSGITGCSKTAADPTATECKITYNEGLSGDDVIKSSLGSRSSKANRGAMSQNGANCLATIGYSTERILEYYYGSDIEIIPTEGACVSGEGYTPVPEQDPTGIGTPCDTGVDCAESEDTDQCEQWYIDATDELYGYCTATCNGLCPGDNLCVDLGNGFGQCAPRPTVANDHCGSIPGTTSRVLSSYGGTTVEWKAVCVNPAEGTACDVGGVRGECVDTSVTICPGDLQTGYCPGPTAVQCCTY